MKTNKTIFGGNMTFSIDTLKLHEKYCKLLQKYKHLSMSKFCKILPLPTMHKLTQVLNLKITIYYSKKKLPIITKAQNLTNTKNNFFIYSIFLTIVTLKNLSFNFTILHNKKEKYREHSLLQQN